MLASMRALVLSRVIIGLFTLKEAAAETITVEPTCAVAGDTTVAINGAGWPEPEPPCTYYLSFDGQQVASQPDGLYGPPIFQFQIPENAQVGCSEDRFKVTLIVDETGEQAGSATFEDDFCVIEGIEEVTWEGQDCHGHGCSNPNGGGTRHFPDANGNTRVKVRAKLDAGGGSAKGCRVFFRSFDPDDVGPYGGDEPVDTNFACDNGQCSSGPCCDNRGAPKAGTLSARVVETNDDGVAETALQLPVPSFPGDNFIVAATADEDYVDGLKLEAADGTHIEDAEQQTLPTDKGAVTDILTLWRVLRIQSDAMQAPNTVAGENIYRGIIQESECKDYLILGQATGICEFVLNVGTTENEANRFESGTLVVPTYRYHVIPYGTGSQTWLSANEPAGRGKTIVRTYSQRGRGFMCPALDDDDFATACHQPDSFYLYDDDNPQMAGGQVNFQWLQDSDDESANKLAPAYIHPVQAGNGGARPWEEYVGECTGADVRSHLRPCPTTPQNWCTTVENAFQCGAKNEGDPFVKCQQSFRTGTSLATSGALVFLETIRDSVRGNVGTFNEKVRVTTVHELGHVLWGCHGDGGVMSNEGTTFSAKTINRMRWIVQPGVVAPGIESTCDDQYPQPNPCAQP